MWDDAATIVCALVFYISMATFFETIGTMFDRGAK